MRYKATSIGASEGPIFTWWTFEDRPRSISHLSLSSDLQRLADGSLKHFETVVMESTRSIWIPVFQVMESEVEVDW